MMQNEYALGGCALPSSMACSTRDAEAISLEATSAAKSALHVRVLTTGCAAAARPSRRIASVSPSLLPAPPAPAVPDAPLVGRQATNSWSASRSRSASRAPPASAANGVPSVGELAESVCGRAKGRHKLTIIASSVAWVSLTSPMANACDLMMVAAWRAALTLPQSTQPLRSVVSVAALGRTSIESISVRRRSASSTLMSACGLAAVGVEAGEGTGAAE
mmetsp:Transcript_37938/g.100322  ORF Transcript_37938/g.100322 Transcript_37938/m.100322 type:complete len:219 (-) Transcript_37938:9-665(-)